MISLPAVILGGDVTALSVARSLTDAGVEVHVLDTHDSPVRVSRLRASFVEVDSEEMQPRMLDWLRTGPKGAVVLACSDEGLELIAHHRPELVELGYRPMEADDDVLLAMLDKDRTEEIAREHGIPAPRTIALRNQADVDAVTAGLSYPCVLKPVHSHVFFRHSKSGAKVLVADSPTELQATFAKMSGIGVALQVIEVITGPDDEYVSYYGYLDEQGEPLLQLTKRKLRQYPNRFGAGTYHAMTHDPEVAEVGLRFLKAAGLRGLGNVEFKRDQGDGQLKLIECNARFTMSNELIRIAGIDLALFAYNRLSGRPAPRVDSYKDDIRLWDPINDTRAFLEYRRNRELSLGDWIGSLRHRQHFPRARLDDPLPALARVWRIVGAASAAATARASRAGRPLWTRGLGTLSEQMTITANDRLLAPAYHLDLVRSTGPGYAWRRLRAERRLSVLGEQLRHEVYERIWREAAEATEAQIVALAPGLFELSRQGTATRVFQQMVALDDGVTLKVALDKALVHRLMASAGVTVPGHAEFDVRDPSPALDFLARADGPCVVKPAAGTGGGSGTTAGVTQPSELMRARLRAAKSSARLLIERQASGAVYRLLFLDGELLDVVRSLPAHVTGDGHSTIEALIAAENARRVAANGAAGLSPQNVNLDMVFALEHAGLRLSSVPPAGRTIALGTVTNNNDVEDNETFSGELAPELIAEARSAQSAVGLRLSGVDVITTDPTRPLADTAGVVTEVNGTPGLHHHYLVADPDKATRVAIPILERLLSRGQAKR
jgi:predicted ATP-grasp superfamily ATP-dependent carboligase